MESVVPFSSIPSQTDTNIETIINNAIQVAIVNNIISIYTYNQQNTLLNEENEFILPDRDDMSSLIFLDIATRFGSPGSDSGFIQKYKNHRNKKIKELGKYKKIKKLENITDPCPICMDDFCCGEYSRTLTCGHLFHKKCIDKWFKKDKNDCPMCRKQILE
jgi:hypothetical protein